jgi:hypothetical protein
MGCRRAFWTGYAYQVFSWEDLILAERETYAANPHVARKGSQFMTSLPSIKSIRVKLETRIGLLIVSTQYHAQADRQTADLALPISKEQDQRCYIRGRCETMGLQSNAGNRLSFIMRAALLLVGLSSYLISPDDVVWHFIKTAPRARLLEHALFAIAAAMLGFALLLEINANPHTENQESHGRPRVTATVASLMQAIGIGSLLPCLVSCCL